MIMDIMTLNIQRPDGIMTVEFNTVTVNIIPEKSRMQKHDSRITVYDCNPAVRLKRMNRNYADAILALKS